MQAAETAVCRAFPGEAGVWMLAPFFTGWGTLGQDRDIPEPRFPYLQNRTSMQLFGGTNEMMDIKPRAQPMAESKPEGPKPESN